ncbi:MAG: J domain-containing protein [Planctomycetes bacterium]|nr:J domain-containing protein [Planctomycetota bacterium]MCB9902567.1 J domain-containing protein [Planctomycetota bacterium]
MADARCPACSTPYTPRDVAAYGVLRARHASRGGPLVEYRCPSCGRVVHLIPHGRGRFARPGEPPGPPPADAELEAPWLDREPEPEAPERVEPAGEPQGARSRAGPATAEPPRPRPAPLDLDEALRLLGLERGATRADAEHAFRERSLSCHPDKVAHLDEDFQRLAEAKFLALSEAFDLVVAAIG